ncbi:MAG TPA: hypothetical protein VH575_18625 [Gemmataceae bacterium]
MNVENAAAFVPLGDAGDFQITVQDLAQLRRHVEHQRSGRQASGDRFAALSRFGLKAFQLIRQPLPQIARQVFTQGDVVAFPVFFVSSVEGDEGNGFAEVELSQGERRQLALA